MGYRLSSFEKMSISAILAFILIICAAIFGYVSNIIKLTRCDFAEPYKAEICRTIGVFLPPIGTIEGFITIKDGKK